MKKKLTSKVVINENAATIQYCLGNWIFATYDIRTKMFITYHKIPKYCGENYGHYNGIWMNSATLLSEIPPRPVVAFEMYKIDRKEFMDDIKPYRVKYYENILQRIENE